MFLTIDYLKKGSKIQKQAFAALTDLNIMNDLADYSPILCGTIPINLNVAGSDLDIILEVKDFVTFKNIIHGLYGDKEEFTLKMKEIRNNPVMKVNFVYSGFEFEIFGQPVPVIKQYAYLHMIIEDYILHESPHLKEKIMLLKEQGYKTEPAFCKVLSIEEGDPYESLLHYGKERGIIHR
ncbi:DUF4269 domain-containing protein [Evansella cellulosilytica]|uniref:DUF4269 domain-containing protein n=1 Tax=Evansella cellulosilytica (strain ATCC 21833 / DSM 2522 / FERM P-1141 / JCM 9156 / N-4) TaxID=649639 RepID=E6TX10_EVAC2|nr:DUF4269 domain-containing protein [Evansella cellulosilytica]ADU31099.1 hypothetical protein Bcell_2846 [Evansella cellulosilytica DSM 2522]